MNKISLFSLCAVALLGSCTPSSKEAGVEYKPVAENTLRAPAYPLVTIDPYTSLWSFTNNLNDEPTRHWTGRNFPVVGGVRVDGVTYRFMGRDQVKVDPVVGTAEQGLWEATYTFTQPEGAWWESGYVPQGWKSGKAAFGTPENPHATVAWQDGDIWVRRTFDWPQDVAKSDLFVQYSHDDNVEVYLNGVKVAVTGNGLDYKENGINLQAILESAGNGILVTGFNGGNCNSTTGNFSYGVEGFAFRDGKITHPVREMLITGNMVSLWQSIMAAGSDAREGARWQIPSLAFGNVDFTGE